MSLNPIDTTKNIKESYVEYLSSLFFLKNQSLAEQAKDLLGESGNFVKGPYIEITPPFRKGKSLADLIQESTLAKDFLHLAERFSYFLYEHQEKAIRKIVLDKRNIVVATGTGSGKTECFLWPIIDYLLKQNEQGQLGSGVRALLLYPMNALANDQMKRLRDILEEYPYLTFGRYTGETLEEKEKAEDHFAKMNPGVRRLKNELLSRKEMRENPPHILLTNYAMLEYLLLRPEDNAFFDGDYSDYWKFIVLDEAHIYRGVKGTEISMLLQRLKDRVVGGETGRLQCIATSATLGDGKDAYSEVANFATGLFHEKFYPDDIIEALREEMKKEIQCCDSHKPDFYERIYQAVNSIDSEEHKLATLKTISKEEKKQIQNDVTKAVTWQEALYHLLKSDRNLVCLQQLVRSRPKLLDNLAVNLFVESDLSLAQKKALMIKLVDIAVKAKLKKDDSELLPSRYHVFVRALEGAYVALWPKEKLFLNRRESFEIGNICVPVFELANCQRCGQEYLIGKINQESKLVQVSSQIDPDSMSYQPPDFFVLSVGSTVNELDEDEVTIDSSIPRDAEQFDLCTHCGVIYKSAKVHKPNCCDNPKIIKVGKIKTRGNSINTCFNCGNHTQNIVKRFLTADGPTTEVLARTLYQNIPAERVKITAPDLYESTDNPFSFLETSSSTKTEDPFIEENGRKLLVFSDSRQEAAYFASFMNFKYNQSLWRHLMLDALQEMNYLSEYTLDDLQQKLQQSVRKYHIKFEKDSEGEIRRKIYRYLLTEFLGIYSEIGLEGLGLVRFNLKKPANWNIVTFLNDALGLNADECWDLYSLLFDSLRMHGAIVFPEDISPTDTVFEPRNRKTYFRLEDSSNTKEHIIFGWMPKEKYANKRLDILKKLFVARGLSEEESKTEARKLLKQMFDKRLIDFLCKTGYLVQEVMPTGGTFYRLHYTRWNVVLPEKSGLRLYRCDKCGMIIHHNVLGVCSRYRCQGKLEEYHGEKTRFTYFKELYENMKPIPMLVEEHTAQLTNIRATELQAEFEKGNVNILSCSTTFEMGVDVGQLEAVFMRNVPPETANYVQRAGRAGRRTDSTAYALTFAKRRSHDLTYYQNPEEIISGKIKTPYVEHANEKVVRRHLHSVVFAWFFARYKNYFGTVDDLFQIDSQRDPVDVVLREELAKNPPDLIAAIRNVIPKILYDSLEIETGGWIEKLLSEEEGNLGILIKAKRGLLDTIQELDHLIEEKFKKKQSVEYYRKMRNTYMSKRGIDFLASRNVLPKYGFPVDLVELDILHDGREASHVELTRDLKLAITEFAPGSQIVAGGKIWEPYAVNRSTQKGWPTYAYAICQTCRKLYSYQSDLSERLEELNQRIEFKCKCGEELKYYKYIIPEFGFSTNTKKPKDPTEQRLSKMYSTQVIFDDYDEVVPKEQEILLGYHSVQYSYSPRGKLFLVNQGINGGFRICSTCGYATVENNQKEHEDRYGSKCKNVWLVPVHFGHSFMTDVLQIKVPYSYTESTGKNELWLSVLYALIEGAVLALGISRNEINGCLYYDPTKLYNPPSFILYDEVPGGAGHVKKISQNLKAVFEGALKKMSGYCGCGEETSCYGCLRNYANQLYHEKLKRGVAYQYLLQVLKPHVSKVSDEVAITSSEDEDELDCF